MSVSSMKKYDYTSDERSFDDDVVEEMIPRDFQPDAILGRSFGALLSMPYLRPEEFPL
jgi:hypothetical protein